MFVCVYCMYVWALQQTSRPPTLEALSAAPVVCRSLVYQWKADEKRTGVIFSLFWENDANLNTRLLNLANFIIHSFISFILVHLNVPAQRV